jgi:hypothetical protein
MHWVSAVAAGGHGEGLLSHFISRVDKLSSNKPQDLPARKRILGRLRKPDGTGGDMPKLPELAAENALGASLTSVQYKRMERWAQGKFESDWPGAEPAPTPFDQLPERDRPHALDRAALESCVGGPFYPGIEASRVMLEAKTYDKKRPFRIKATLGPGALTADMAVPWQADFQSCSMDPDENDINADWWPGQRPNQVRRDQDVLEDWAPRSWKRRDMVKKWMRLGFVVQKTVAGKVQYVEDERQEPVSPPTA